MLFDSLLFLLACAGLGIGGFLTVRSLTKITYYYGMREFVIGFIIMAIATSIPELFIGISSVFSGIPSLSFGDIIGSNIADLSLVLGIVVLVGKELKVGKKIKRDIIYASIISFLPILLFLDQKISNLDGVILLFVFSVYIVHLFLERKEHTKYFYMKKDTIKKETFIFLFGLIILLASARFITQFASLLISELSLPPVFIGLLIVSIGTSLPELSFETQSLIKGHSELALGDLLGSLVINSTLVLGLVSLLSPIKAEFPSFSIGAVFFFLILIFFSYVLFKKQKVSKKHAKILLILYVIYILVSILSKTV